VSHLWGLTSRDLAHTLRSGKPSRGESLNARTLTRRVALAATAGAIIAASLGAVNASAAGIPHVVRSAATTSDTGSAGVNFAHPTLSGHLLVAFVSANTGSPGAINVTDNGGNSWTRAVAVGNGSVDIAGEIWYAANALSVTEVLVQTAFQSNLAARVDEVAGVVKVSPLETTNLNSDFGTTLSSFEVGVAATNDMVMAALTGHSITQRMTVTATGWNNQRQIKLAPPLTDAVSLAVGWKNGVFGNAENYTATVPVAMNWSGLIVVFQGR
jgi:hypothetical protein